MDKNIVSLVVGCNNPGIIETISSHFRSHLDDPEISTKMLSSNSNVFDCKRNQYVFSIELCVDNYHKNFGKLKNLDDLVSDLYESIGVKLQSQVKQLNKATGLEWLKRKIKNRKLKKSKNKYLCVLIASSICESQTVELRIAQSLYDEHDDYNNALSEWLIEIFNIITGII